ncbi:MAG: NAD(P)-dependent oxidoreductase, partial [Candidatus Anstonellales archaeon]
MIAIIGKSILGQEIYNYLPVKNKIIISRSDGIQYIREDFVKKLKTAKAIIWAAGSYNAKDMQREHIKPIEELVSALKRQQKLIYTSSISVYGKSIKREIDENIEINPDTKYAMAKAKAEQIAKEHENTIIFRLGVLYSHKYKAYSTIFKLISLGICPYFGNGQNNVPFTYIKDVLPCYKNALSLQGNDIYNVSGKGCKQMY